MSVSPLDHYPRWHGYDDLPGPLNTLTRADARSAFDHFLADADERVRTLRRFLAEVAGIDATLDERGVAAIDTWLWPWLADLIRRDLIEQEQHSGLLHDVGVFAGEALIHERPGVRWNLLTKGPRVTKGYQSAVLAPFPAGYEPYWAVTAETIADGYVLANRVVGKRQPSFSPRLLFRYKLFAGKIPWPDLASA